MPDGKWFEPGDVAYESLDEAIKAFGVRCRNREREREEEAAAEAAKPAEEEGR
jgi:hypothetical protein